jgi:hypothetical protein
MNNIPKGLKDKMADNNFYRICVKGRKGFTSECRGRITWEHALYFAGKQVQEEWAIIPLCQYHHSVGKWQNAGGLDKRFNEWVALNRLFSLPEDEHQKMKKKYAKVYDEWKRRVKFLNNFYGRYNFKG